MQTATHEENASRSVVNTGAAGGIGSALLRRFLARGARVYAADRDQGALGRLRTNLGSASRLSTAVLDVSDEAQCLDFAARVRAEWNGVDVLVNAAGWFPLTPFEQVTYAQWREIIAVNLDSPFLVTRSLLPLLKASRAGRIIFFSSASIYGGNAEQCPYVSAKAGLIDLTRSLAKVVGGHGITVNAVTPGLTVTAPIKKLFPADALSPGGTIARAQARRASGGPRRRSLISWPRRTRPSSPDRSSTSMAARSFTEQP